MLDPKYVRENIDLIATAAQNKGFPFDAEQFISIFDKRLQLIQQTESLRAQRKQGSNTVKNIADAQQRSFAIAQMQVLGLDLEKAEKELRAVEEEFRLLLLAVPNISSVDTPIGKSEADNVELYKIGHLPKFDFMPKSHIELGKDLGILDFERSAQIAGSRSYSLLGLGAELERAVHSLTLDLLKSKNYRQMTVPVLVRSEAMEGSGYLPLGAEQAYFIEKDGLWLVGTAEVPLISYYQNDLLDLNNLPQKVHALSTCFRREAGAAGKDTKGLYRVHQFHKIEQVIICEPDITISDKLHAELLQNAEILLQLLELPYRVVQVCTGDLGQGQVKKNDIETWMPSRNSYGETHSCSSFYDFQARRLKIKTRTGDGKTKFCFTLNNTAAATPRLLIALLENHQRADGTIALPKALQKYMGVDSIGFV